MKFNKLIFILFIINLFCLIKNPLFSFAKESRLPPQVIAYAGKSFIGTKSPSFLSYENKLRPYLIKRINKKFGLDLSLTPYSVFDLLEIESLLRFKRSNESPEMFLKIFPKGYW